MPEALAMAGQNSGGHENRATDPYKSGHETTNTAGANASMPANTFEKRASTNGTAH